MYRHALMRMEPVRLEIPTAGWAGRHSDFGGADLADDEIALAIAHRQLGHERMPAGKNWGSKVGV